LKGVSAESYIFITSYIHVLSTVASTVNYLLKRTQLFLL
jgi:hypothetical protein